MKKLSPQISQWFVFAAVVAVFGFFTTEFVGPYYQTILAICGINMILAMSLNLVNGFTGQFSLGCAGFMAVGAYASASFTTLLLPALNFEYLNSGLLQEAVFAVAILIGGLGAALAGVIVGAPSLRLKGDYLAVVTLGFGEIIRITILNIESIGGARGFIGIPQLSNLYWIFGMVFLTLICLHRLLKSIPGKQFMAVRDDETATLAMGLSTTKIKVRSFVFSSFFAGVAGALFAHNYAYLNPATFNFNYSFQIVAMVVLGGMGSLSGSAVAAILLTGMLEALRPIQEITGVDFRMVIYALVLIVLMLTRPIGMFGHREVWQSFSWRRFRKKAAL